MAGAGFKTFNTGDVLLASEVNTYLMQQTVMVFDDATARTSALGANVAEGMFSYLKDTNLTYRYDGSAWLSDAGTTSPLTTKGDLWTYSTTDARLPVGTDGHTLVADSATATGLKWAAASASYTWQNWTPTWTNLTLGNGTVIARYVQVDKLVSIYIKLTFGSTTSITGAPVQFSVPVNTTTDWQNLPIGMAQYYDTGTAAYIGWGYFEGANDKIGLYVAKVDTTYMNSQNGITATVPHTWANTDVISLTFTYEAA